MLHTNTGWQYVFITWCTYHSNFRERRHDSNFRKRPPPPPCRPPSIFVSIMQRHVFKSCFDTISSTQPHHYTPVLNHITMQVCIGVHGKNVYTHKQSRDKSNNAAIRRVFLQMFENVLNQRFYTLGDLKSYVCGTVFESWRDHSSKLVLWYRTRCQGCVNVCVDADNVY